MHDAWSVWENWAWVICVWCLHVCVSVVHDMCVACPWNKLHTAIAPCSDSLHEIPVHAHIRPHTHEPGGEFPPCTHLPWVPCVHHLHYMQQHNGWKTAQDVWCFTRTVVWAGTNEWLHLKSFKSSPPRMLFKYKNIWSSIALKLEEDN